jgi:hypothetical protein
MDVVAIQARISLTDSEAIASVGGLPTDENTVVTLGEALADAGSLFLHEVICRNTPTDAALLKRFQRAVASLAQAMKALELPRVPEEMPAREELTDVRPRIRQTLNRMAMLTRHRSEPANADTDQRVPQALERVNTLLEAVPDLWSLLRLTVRQLEHDASIRLQNDGAGATAEPVSPPPAVTGRQTVRSTSIASVIMGPPPPLGSGYHGDLALDRLLWRLWHIHVHIKQRLPGTSVHGTEHENEGKASGPFLRYCRAALDWLRTQVADDLYERDPKLQKCFRSSASALRARLQRVIDFGTMRRK